MAKFQREHPDRFINVGVAEQSMIGIAAGLALRGMRPYAYTIATFSLYRPFEMVRNDLCYQNLPVTVVGIGGGVIYSNLGGTHYAQEDLAIAGALPNMTILCPCDPLEAEAATIWTATRETGGPVYLRMGKAGEPTITEGAEDPFVVGKIRRLSVGEDIAVVSHGVIMTMAMEISERLRARGKSVSLISCGTLKPLDKEGLSDMLRRHKTVIALEEHVPQGGMVPQLKQLAWEIGATSKILGFTLKDEFVHCYGNHADLLAAHGLSADQILAVYDQGQ